MTNETIGLVIRGVISLVIIAGWIVTLSIRPDVSAQFQPAILALITFWFGDSILARVQAIRADSHAASVTIAQAQAQAQPGGAVVVDQSVERIKPL